MFRRRPPAQLTQTPLQVHLDDLLDVYELVLAKALAEPRARSSPFAKFVLVSSGKHTWGEMAEVVARALHARGVIPTQKVSTISWEEASTVNPWALYVGTNSFAIPTRARLLGWTPKRLDWRADVDTDVELHLKTLGRL